MSYYVMLTIASILSVTPEDITGWYVDDHDIETTDMIINACYTEDNLTEYMKSNQMNQYTFTQPITCAIKDITTRSIVQCNTHILEDDTGVPLVEAYFFWVSDNETFQRQAFKHTTVCMQQYTVRKADPPLPHNKICLIQLEDVKATIGACNN